MLMLHMPQFLSLFQTIRLLRVKGEYRCGGGGQYSLNLILWCQAYLVSLAISIGNEKMYVFSHYTVRPNKILHFSKVPHINISKYFQKISIDVGSYGSLLSNDTKEIDDIVCLSEQEPHL